VEKPISELKDRLKKALAMKQITPIELSEKTKIPKSSISQYMSGHVKPKQDRIYLICKALNINEAWLIGYDVPMERKELSGKTADEDIELIGKMSLLNDKDKILVINLIDSLLEKAGLH